MRRRHDNQDSDGLPGQDSFLDIVANIVGILILLVVVVGVRASRHVVEVSASKQEAPAAPTSHAVTDKEVQRAIQRTAATRSDIKDMVKRIVNVRREALMRDDERVQLNTLVAAFEQEIDKRRADLDKSQQRDFDLRRKLSDSQYTLDELTREQVSLLSQTPEIEELTNLPTPLAKTVTGEEVHLRLYGGHVAFIPLNDLITDLREHAEQNLWRLENQASVVSTVGPLNGFRLRYYLQKSRFTRRLPGGATQETTAVQLAKWKLVPESRVLGERVAAAVLPNSDLMHYLKSYRPQSTVITVWTYPGSFTEFRALKEALFNLGFSTAGRPLPEGVLIGGSPAGTKSAAQ